jgi:glycosyltransferase involved in cell wall biosynthesis
VRIIFVAEGDAETHDSWSGASRSVVAALREHGNTVQVGDADLYGMKRIAIAVRTLAWPRKRWWVRYHLHGSAFRARSAACARVVDELGRDADVLLQVGATFAPPESSDLPLALYCDSNVELSRLGAATGHSEGSALTAKELASVREREARVYERASIIFTMSEQVRRSFIEDFGIAPDRLVTVYCGPNIVVADPTSGRGAQDRTTPTVLFVGRDFGRKGGSVLVDAFSEVRAAIPGARLRIVTGTEPGSWAAAPGVEYLGFLSRDTVRGREAMDEAYRSATVFCLPTRFEPFGTSFVEAMMYGLPCVGPSVWAVPEIIRHEETGLLVPPEDPGALAEALKRLLDDPALSARMGAAGRARAAEHFSWAGAAGKMSRALAGLVRRDPVPRSVVGREPTVV